MAGESSELQCGQLILGFEKFIGAAVGTEVTCEYFSFEGSQACGAIARIVDHPRYPDKGVIRTFDKVSKAPLHEPCPRFAEEIRRGTPSPDDLGNG